MSATSQIPVYHSYGKWFLSGVNTWTLNMRQAMDGSCFDQRVLVTGIAPTEIPEANDAGMPCEFLHLPANRSLRLEWQALKEFLEARAPCIYIPNFDFHRSCAVGTLDPKVRVCGVVHSDDPLYYDEIKRLGHNFDRIVGVSKRVCTRIHQLFPSTADRVRHIPYGIPVPNKPSGRRIGNKVHLAYCNRLLQSQKRVFDLPEVLSGILKRGIDAHLTIAGDGRDGDALKRLFNTSGLSDRVSFLGKISNNQVIELCGRSHFFILTSNYEGLPISLLEAMSVGCVPCVYKIESGVQELLTGSLQDCLVPHGEPERIAEWVSQVANSPSRWEQLSGESARRIQKHHSLESMGLAYETLFKQLMQETVERDQKIHRPKDLTLRWRIKQKLSRLGK
jgi:glycosyltransferase involved in cell wall biosynthesis